MLIHPCQSMLSLLPTFQWLSTGTISEISNERIYKKVQKC